MGLPSLYSWDPLTVAGNVSATGVYNRSGTGSPSALSNLMFQAWDTVNGYIQSNVQNLSNGASASADHIVTCDTGTDSTGYADFGINGSAYSVGTWTVNGAKDAYLYCAGGGVAVGTDTAGKNVLIFTGGTMAANVRITVADALTTFATACTHSITTTFTQAATFTAYAGGTTAGMFWNDTTQKCHTSYLQGMKQFQATTIFTQTADGTNGSATAATSILGTGVGTLTLPGSFFVVGKTIRVTGTGVFTTSGTPGTVTLTLQLGAVVIATSAAVTPTASQTNKFFEFDFLLTCRSATTIQGSGAIYMDATLTTIGVPNTTTATIVNATSYAVNVLSANSSASGCVWTTKTCAVQVLN